MTIQITPRPAKEWLRIHEASAFSGIGKATLYDLMKKGLLRNVSLKGAEQIKGTRLISFSSLRSLLDGRAAGGVPEEPLMANHSEGGVR